MLIDLNEAAILERADTLNNLAVTKGNVLSLEELRTENSKLIKRYKDEIAKLKEEFLKPFTEQEALILAEIEPLEKALSDFSKRLLATKKDRFMDKVREQWERTSLSDPDGVVIPFEEVYDPTWYGKSESVWLSLLNASIQEKKDEQSPVETTITIKCGRSKLRGVFEYLISRGITFIKEEK